jgi:hypothetical protein
MFKMTELALEQDVTILERMTFNNQLQALKAEDERFENELRLLKMKVEEGNAHGYYL